MIGLPVGSWDDEVDLDRVMKEVVGDCQTFLEDDALQPSPLSKKRKKIAEGLQNNVLEPSRSSKRLSVGITAVVATLDVYRCRHTIFRTS